MLSIEIEDLVSHLFEIVDFGKNQFAVFVHLDVPVQKARTAVR
jgi:hypothetical protein